jgi:mono/diheme cytochrome c family protein
MTQHSTSVKWPRLLSLILLAIVLVACGGDSGDPSAASVPRPTNQPVPTMPAARFTAVAQQVYTDTASSIAVGTPAVTPTASVDLTRGQTIYNNRCADCHGPQGEGVADKGSALTGLTLTSTEFDNVVRTGKSGELGTEHVFGPSAVSPSGLSVLYAFVQSLSE